MSSANDARSSLADQPRPVRGSAVLSADAFESRVAAELGVTRSDVVPDARLLEDVGLDSLGMLELALLLDDMGAHFDAEDLARISRVGDVYRIYVERRTLSQYGELSCESGPEPWSREGDGVPGRSTPRLTSRRTRQRPVVVVDYPYLYDLTRSEAAATFWRHRGRVVSPEQFVTVLWDEVLAQHVILDAATGAPVGLVTAYDADLGKGIAYLALVLDPRVQGHGWPLEAVALFVEYLFRRWPLRKIHVEALASSAQAVASGLGKLFVEEGRYSSHEYVDGKWVDLHILSVFRERWEADARHLVDDVTGSTNARPVAVALRNGHHGSG